MSKSNTPQARTQDLTVKPMADELLVYDLNTHQASCLNPTAAAVWKYSDGTRDVDAIAQAVSTELHAPVESSVVWYALKQLGDQNLLQTAVTPPALIAGMKRRDFIKGAALVGVGVAIPVVVSMAAPKSADAASCVGLNQPCTSGPGCCAGLICFSGFCVGM